ncbi:MAG: nicotianamine synthase family protein [Spirochaetota bacterium]|nr:nicotianamine synthase family protein [Spirochaetota bacterium]
MHEIEIQHNHELDEHNFLGCCLDCQKSLDIIKPHILTFYDNIKVHTQNSLKKLSIEELYQLYQALDDIAHIEVGDHLGELILTDKEIRSVLPSIRFYYSFFFDIHEENLAHNICNSSDPWKVLENFALYPRYESLITSQWDLLRLNKDTRIAFIGAGFVPITLILLNRIYGTPSIGFDTNPEAISMGRECIKKLGMEKDIKLEYGNEKGLLSNDWDSILVAALAEPKKRIFKNLKKILKKKGSKPVCFRTYTGIRSVLYYPVREKDIKDFKIIDKSYPTGRVNNTLVFAELKR